MPNQSDFEYVGAIIVYFNLSPGIMLITLGSARHHAMARSDTVLPSFCAIDLILSKASRISLSQPGPPCLQRGCYEPSMSCYRSLNGIGNEKPNNFICKSWEYINSTLLTVQRSRACSFASLRQSAWCGCGWCPAHRRPCRHSCR